VAQTETAHSTKRLETTTPETNTAQSNAAKAESALVGSVDELPKKATKEPSQLKTITDKTGDLYMDDSKDIKRAAAYRTKYAKKQKLRMAPILVGAHPQNREGIGPNPSRCEQLFSRDLLGKFDPAEADFEAVAVEGKPSSDMFTEYLRRHCEHEPGLAAVKSFIAYGSIGHQHVNQIMRNIVGGVQISKGCLKTYPAVAKVCDPAGHINLDLLKSSDLELWKAAQEGLLWQVLRWEMEVDEPDAVSCISRALNNKASACMLRHEMEVSCLLFVVYCLLLAVWNRSWAAAL
jgi:hypothetical protein